MTSDFVLRTLRWLGPTAAVWLTTPGWAQLRQDGNDAAQQEFRAEAPERPADMPLALLPEPPGRRRIPPRKAALEAMDQLLERITSPDPVLAKRAQRSLLEAKRDWPGGIAQRIARLADESDKLAQKKLLQKLRDDARAALSRDEETPDYLDLALESPDPKNKDWKQLVELLALSRMLGAIETTDSVRILIDIYVRFGEYMRVDCQRQLEALGDASVAGLIEASSHPALKIQKWANRRLALRGIKSADDAVRVEDKSALPEILIALGRKRDPNTARMLVSFASAQSTATRRAARQAIVLLGDVGTWQLRDAYLNLTGKRSPREWTWKRTARELFTEFDRLRLEEIYSHYQRGTQAEKSDKLEQMAQHFDRVLTIDPLFDQGAQMAPGYLKYARSVEKDHPQKALLAARRAERIAKLGPDKDAAASYRLLLEAKSLLAEGVADRTLFARAVQLDPSHRVEAEKLLAPPHLTPPRWGLRSRWALAISIALLSLGGAAWVALTSFWRRHDKTKPDIPGVSADPRSSPKAATDPAKTSKQ